MDISAVASTVVRVSRGTFDPLRFADIREMMDATAVYLVPAIRELPGLISYSAGASASGSLVHVSIWDSEEHADQMSHLRLMIVDAREAAERAGVVFTPIVNYPIDWSV